MKEDIYTSFVEAEQEFLRVYNDLMRNDEVSLLKNDILDNEIQILALSFKNILLEIDMYRNNQRENYIKKLQLILLLIIVSLIIAIINPFFGVIGTLLCIRGFFKTRDNAIEDIEHLEFKTIINNVKNKLDSLEELKSILNIKNKKREARLEKERLKSKKGYLAIDLANKALGVYLTTLEIPNMSDTVQWALIRMLQDDFNTKETNIEVLLNLAYDKTPLYILEEGTKLKRSRG